MLRFFRQIRQSLIIPDTARKYLFYALGEILLVVIGILIALQVNTWNQQRIELKLRDELITSYAKDLTANADYIRQRKNLIETNLESINQLSVRLKANTTADTLKKIALEEFSSSYFAITDLKNDTYQSLVSNNELRILPKDLSAMMIEIDFLMADLIKTQYTVIDMYRDVLTEYVFIYPTNHSISIYSRSETESLWNTIDQNEWKLAFNGLTFTKIAGYSSVLPRTDTLLTKIDQTLTYIENNNN